MTETVSAPSQDPSLVNKFRETAQSTRRPDAWRQTWQQVPEEDRGRNAIEAVVKLGATKRDIKLTEDQILDYADQYDELREIVGIDPSDQTVDHETLVGLLLPEKATDGQAAIPAELQPQSAISRRSFLIGAATGAVAAVAAPMFATIHRSETKAKEQLTVFDEFIKPLIDEAHRRRAERARIDPEYYHRVDKELNEDKKGDPERINFLLFSTGTVLRPGNSPAIHGANQILSLNLRTRTVDLISITSETRAPNIERYLQKTRGETSQIRSINGAFDFGQEVAGDAEGFNLMRETFEQATGLSMDFQVVFSDGRIKDFIDQVLGGLDVDLPYDLPTYKIDVDGVEYPDQNFRLGKQHLDGVGVIQFMKGENHQGKWEKGRLPHHRKNIIFDGLTKTVKGNLTNPILAPVFAGKLGMYLNRQLEEGKFKLDFDLNSVLNFGVLKDSALMVGRPLGFNDLRVDQTITMMNPDMGGEGVRYVGEDREKNPITAKDIAEGVYPNHYEDVPGAQWWSGVVVPYNANPHSEDLVSDYWVETRRVVRTKLLHAA